MLKFGIDTLSFYTSHYALDLARLAEVRGVDPDKYFVGLGQRKMAVPAPDEDIVTMAAVAAQAAIHAERRGWWSRSGSSATYSLPDGAHSSEDPATNSRTGDLKKFLP